MATKTKTKAKPVRLRAVLRAIKTRREQGGRLTQADYAVALDKIVRAISRSQKDRKVIITAVRVL